MPPSVLVRPSYVLGGAGMRIAISDDDIDQYIGEINRYTQEHPILVDKYIVGKEIEVDAVCDGTDILIPGIMEHIERAGIHSGDSISVYPTFSVSEEISRFTSSTLLISSEKNAIGFLKSTAALRANPNTKAVLPMAGRAAMIFRVARCQPFVRRSRPAKPDGTPDIPSSC